MGRKKCCDDKTRIAALRNGQWDAQFAMKEKEIIDFEIYIKVMKVLTSTSANKLQFVK